MAPPEARSYETNRSEVLYFIELTAHHPSKKSPNGVERGAFFGAISVGARKRAVARHGTL